MYAETKLTAPLAALLLRLLFTPETSVADSWTLMTPEFTITETEITPSNKWVALESFPSFTM